MKRVGFIGLGLMGKPMAKNVMKAGYLVAVYNRTREKAKEFEGSGVYVANNPREVAELSDVVITMLADSNAVREVILGKDGVLEGAKRGSIIIDMSTVSPSVSREIALAASAKGVKFLDAPVGGSVKPATEGTLTIMVGGEKEVFEECLDVLRTMGKNVHYMGGNGMGSFMKLVNQVNLALIMEALCESLALGVKGGLDPNQIYEVIMGYPSIKTGVSENRLPMILKGNLAAGFPLKHMFKDIELVVEEASKLKLPLPALRAAREVYKKALDAGLGDLDFSAVSKVIEEEAGIRFAK